MQQTASTNSAKILLCHGCLVSNVKLFDMRKYKLLDLFTDLVGRKIDFEAKVPQHLCSYCAKLLLNFNTFRSRCTRALELLENAHKTHMVTTESITKINRDSNNLVLPYTKTILNNCSNVIVTHSNNVNGAYDFEFHHEDNILIKNDVIKSEYDCNEDPVTNDLKNDGIKFMDVDINNLQDTLEHSKPTVINFAEANIDSEIVTDEDFDGNDIDTDIEITINSANEKIHRNSKPKTKKCRLKKHYTKCESISKKLNVDIKLLSYEEQIKELDNRKLSINYKQATYKCSLCYKGFALEEFYNNHMTLHSASSGDLICDICKFRFRTKATLSVHLKRHQMILTCKECGHVSSQIRMATVHFEFHSGTKYPCKYCPKVYNRRTTCYGHMRYVHASTLLRCELCGDGFNGAFGLKSHERRTHTVSPDCECSRCGLQFYTREAFDAHQKNEDRLCDLELKYCVRCGAAFDTDELLRQHEIEQQKFGGCFACSLCNKKFKALEYYKKHFKKYHPSAKECRIPPAVPCRPVNDAQYCRERNGSFSLLCEICGKTFKNNGLLLLHHRSKHSSEYRRLNQCNSCSKSFISRRALEDHIRTHTGERPYHCELCPKTFNCVQNLKRHSIVHTRDRPHSCHICEKRFQTSSCVKVHVQTVHMKIPQPPRTRKKKSK